MEIEEITANPYDGYNHMDILNVRHPNIKYAELDALLNHLYIFTDDLEYLYNKSKDINDIMVEHMDEYMRITRMYAWKDVDYITQYYDWFISELKDWLDSWDLLMEANKVKISFACCFVRWLKSVGIDYRSIGVPQSMISYTSCMELDKSAITDRLACIEERNKQCAIQGTPEWHSQRHSVITASIAWKAVDTDANRKSLINEKCGDRKGYDGRTIYDPDNLNALQKGHCYEPVSVMVYEYIYNTKLGFYGCLPHTDISCIGASPDGININPDSAKYGRLVEIKNVSSRTLTGIPKKEYWVQTQIQMEVCNLDECDFLECDFKEYETKEEYDLDGEGNRTAVGGWKGIMSIYIECDTNYTYQYCPMGITEDEWMKTAKTGNWMRNKYWYLNTYSCVCIPRNKLWFELNKSKYMDIWREIEEQRRVGVIKPRIVCLVKMPKPEKVLEMTMD
jgi:hypothetical protein